MRGIFVCLGLVVLASGGGCSSPPEPPHGIDGLSFGDPPPATAIPIRVPLPGALGDSLRFYRQSGEKGMFLGVPLSRPVLAFYRDRLFSIAAELTQRQAGETLRGRLSRDYGPPYCRDGGKLAVCLWRVGEVDVVLETPETGATRIMVRHRPTAGQVAAATGRPADAPFGLESPPDETDR